MIDLPRVDGRFIRQHPRRAAGRKEDREPSSCSNSDTLEAVARRAPMRSRSPRSSKTLSRDTAISRCSRSDLVTNSSPTCRSTSTCRRSDLEPRRDIDREILEPMFTRPRVRLARRQTLPQDEKDRARNSRSTTTSSGTEAALDDLLALPARRRLGSPSTRRPRASIRMAAPTSSAISMAWPEAGTAYYVPLQPRSAAARRKPGRAARSAYETLLEDPAPSRRPCKNVKYDMGTSSAERRRRRCGVSTSTPCSPRTSSPPGEQGGHGLDTLSRCGTSAYKKIPTKEHASEPARSRRPSTRSTSTWSASYAAEDADFTWRLRERLEPELDEFEWSVGDEFTRLPRHQLHARPGRSRAPEVVDRAGLDRNAPRAERPCSSSVVISNRLDTDRSPFRVATCLAVISACKLAPSEKYNV